MIEVSFVIQREGCQRTSKSTYEKYWQKKCFENRYISTQDGDPSHTWDLTQEKFIYHFRAVWDKNMWSPSSPDIESIYFAIRSILESYVSYKSYSSAAAPNFFFLFHGPLSHYCRLKLMVKVRWRNFEIWFLCYISNIRFNWCAKLHYPTLGGHHVIVYIRTSWK